MKRRMVYVVSGSTGEYSDRTDWTVCAFETKAKAEALVKRLAAWCDERGVGENPKVDRDDDGDLGRPEEDPGFMCDYTGTRYAVEAVELR